MQLEKIFRVIETSRKITFFALTICFDWEENNEEKFAHLEEGCSAVLPFKDQVKLIARVQSMNDLKSDKYLENTVRAKCKSWF